jgi:hypothetical protein
MKRTSRIGPRNEAGCGIRIPCFSLFRNKSGEVLIELRELSMTMIPVVLSFLGVTWCSVQILISFRFYLFQVYTRNLPFLSLVPI